MTDYLVNLPNSPELETIKSELININQNLTGSNQRVFELELSIQEMVKSIESINIKLNSLSPDPSPSASVKVTDNTGNPDNLNLGHGLFDCPVGETVEGGTPLLRGSVAYGERIVIENTPSIYWSDHEGVKQ